MHKCQNCGKLTSNGQYNYNNKFTCRDCLHLVEEFHTNPIVIDKAGPRMVELFFGVEENVMRQKFIDFLYLLFDRKINPAAYRLMNSYRRKGYTWVGMIRAMEWFYIIRKNSLSKSKNNIGIIPHIYDEAQQFYNIQADKAFQKALKWYNSKDAIVEETIISKTEKKINKEIDMMEI